MRIICPERWFSGASSAATVPTGLVVHLAPLYPPDDALPVPPPPNDSFRWRYWVEGFEQPSHVSQDHGFSIKFLIITLDPLVYGHVSSRYGSEWQEFGSWRPEQFERHRCDRPVEIIAITNAILPMSVLTMPSDAVIEPQRDAFYPHVLVEQDRPGCPSAVYDAIFTRRPQSQRESRAEGRRPYVPRLEVHKDPARCSFKYPLP